MTFFSLAGGRKGRFASNLQIIVYLLRKINLSRNCRETRRFLIVVNFISHINDVFQSREQSQRSICFKFADNCLFATDNRMIEKSASHLKFLSRNKFFQSYK